MENREIKFRAWCSGKHGNIEFSKSEMDYEFFLSPNGFYVDVESGWDIQGVISTVPIMQYTGLKDRNGKDIYEFDYVINQFGERILVEYDFSLLRKLKEIEKYLMVDGNLYE